VGGVDSAADVDKGEFEELGTLNTAGWKQKDTKKMYEDFQKQAAKWGADAVLLTSEGVSGVKDNQWSKATAIRYTRAPTESADDGG